jgi:hypothetical protein
MTCVECGKTFSQDDLILLAQSWVCASCKPTVLQRMSEGVRVPGPKGAVWRSKKDFVIRLGGEMPDVCIRCNEPAGGYRLKRELSWHSGWLYLLLLAGVLIYVIVALVVRKKAVVNVGLCQTHRAQRRNGILVSLATAVVGLALAFSVTNGYLVLLGVLMFFGGIIASPLMARIVHATRIDSQYVRLRGAGEPFLATLPPFTDTIR